MAFRCLEVIELGCQIKFSYAYLSAFMPGLTSLTNHLFNVVPRQKYCESIHKTVRRKTRTVMVGNVAIGSEHPIRVQTMTTNDTKDVAGTVEEVL